MSDNAALLDPNAKATKAAWAILAAMGFGAFIAQMFSTVIGPALPTIKGDLSLSLSMQTWTITSYSLAFGTALVAGGRLGDIVGEVRMIVIGFIVFGGGLVVAAIAAGGGMLVAGRTIQGIGIGLSAPATLSIVVNSFPLLKRGLAVGTWGFAHGFGLLVGPLIGGYLTETIGWRWVFWIAVPLTVAVILVTLLATRGYKSVLAKGSYDIVGLIFGGIGITAVTYGLQNSAAGWGLPGTWGSIVLGIVLLVIFAIVEMKIEFPLVEFGLWKERLFSGGFFAECAVGFVYIPMLTFVGSLYFINVLGYSPVKAGYVIIITTGVCMVLEPPAGRFVDKVGPGIPIAVGLGLQAVALFWFGTLTPETSFGMLVIPLALMGAGVGISLPACNTAGMTAVDAEHAGMGSGLMQMTFNIPAALGVAVATSVVGTVSASKVLSATNGQPYADKAVEYNAALQAGDTSTADNIINSVSSIIADAIHHAAIAAQSSAIALSMVAMGIVAVAGVIMTVLVIGRRRTPDHVEITQAAAV
ncbi:MAG: MFS transporter [Actinomycetes bacterium]